MTVGQAKILFDLSNLSETMVNMSDQVVGVLEKVNAALVKIDRVSITVDALENTVEGIATRVNNLTALVQSNQVVQAPPNANATPGANQQATNANVWACGPELRVCFFLYDSLSFCNYAPADRRKLQGAIITAAHRFIIMPSLESYTALETPERQWLAQSLFNCIKVCHWISHMVHFDHF